MDTNQITTPNRIVNVIYKENNFINYIPVLTPVFMLMPPTSTATATAKPAAKKPTTPNIFSSDCDHFLTFVHFGAQIIGSQVEEMYSFCFTHMSPCNETTATRQRLCEAEESYLRSRRELAASLVRETRDNNV